VTTRGGKITRDPLYHEPVSKKKTVEVVEVEEEETLTTPKEKVRTKPYEFYDTHVFPFQKGNRKQPRMNNSRNS
jgi:hypothetical protein